MNSRRTKAFRSALTLTALVVYGRCLASTSFSPGVGIGTVANSAINEASGIAVSRSNANVLWTHNDSGDDPRVFAMTPSGTNLGTYEVLGASANDWEDIAVGPGPENGLQYLYIGDIGDNNANDPNISIYRVPEPAVSATQTSVTTSLSGATKLTFAYPNGPRDAESLFVDPLTRDIYILTKRENPHRLYRAAYPQPTSGVTMLEQVATYADPNWLTAADISPDGDEIIARGAGIDTGRLFVRPPGGTVADALNSTPVTIPLVFELQGEAIGFDPQGWGYYTVSEFSNSPIHYFNRIADPGDFNRDGIVDAADFVALRKTDYTPSAYSTWHSNFAATSSAGSAVANQAPEPSYVGAFVAGLVTMALRRQLRQYFPRSNIKLVEF